MSKHILNSDQDLLDVLLKEKIISQALTPEQLESDMTVQFVYSDIFPEDLPDFAPKWIKELKETEAPFNTFLYMVPEEFFGQDVTNIMYTEIKPLEVTDDFKRYYLQYTRGNHIHDFVNDIDGTPINIHKTLK